jgi:copper(I)-binding protein
MLCLAAAAAAAAMLLPSSRAEPAKEAVTVQDAWVRAVPPSANVTAAYMVIKNDSDEPAALESIETNAASSAELHRMSRDRGMMTMAPVPSVPIPAHGRAALEPSGYHLMLIGLKKPLRAGDRVKLILHFRGRRTLAVTATVQDSADAGAKP